MVGIIDTVANKIQGGFDAVNEFVAPNLKHLEPGIRKVQKLAENVTSAKRSYERVSEGKTSRWGYWSY